MSRPFCDALNSKLWFVIVFDDFLGDDARLAGERERLRIKRLRHAARRARTKSNCPGSTYMTF